MMLYLKRICDLATILIISAGAANSASSLAQELPKLDVTVFSAPSQSVWIPVLIQKLGIDRKHGFVLAVTQKPSQVAYTDFATGKDPVCFCAAIPAVSRFKQQGADITLLWNIFSFESDIVLHDTGIKKLSDLEGKTLQTDTITGGWALSKWFLKERGLDLSNVQVKSSSSRGSSAVAELRLGRVDALLVNPIEGAAAVLQGEGELRTIPVFDPVLWKKISGTDFVPQIALGVSGKWISLPENQQLVRRFYAANLEVARYIQAHPAESARLVAPVARLDAASMEQVLRRYSNLIHIEPLRPHLKTIALLTQKLLPEAGLLQQPLSDAELQSLIYDFKTE